MQIPILSGNAGRFYVYAHSRKDTGEVFYIGKGKGRRAYAAHPKTRSQWWQNVVAKAGGFEVAFLHSDLAECDALRLEVEEIAQHKGAGARLVNLTDGGDGTSGLKRSAKWRAFMSRVHKGKTLSPETRAKISAAVRASGYVPTPETRRKISETHKGQQRSLGYRHTDEWKAAQRERAKGNLSRTGQIRGAEERAKASASLKGRKQTVITCPHCGKSGGNAMRRHHFDNCKKVSANAN